MPLATGAALKAAVLGAIIVTAVILGAPLDRARMGAWIDSRRTAVSLQPYALQVIEMLLIADLLGYWAHRLLHGKLLWKFHAVHHAPRELHWLSSVRLHPMHEVVKSIIQMVPLFAPATLNTGG